MLTPQENFITEAIRYRVLRFGDFTLKSGRKSSYFFNIGNFASGAALEQLGDAYAQRLLDLGTEFDLLFGPAYKGIPLATAVAIALRRRDIEVEVAFDRKEVKTHGEAGRLFGAAIEGKRVVVVDDVITDGMAKREAAELIEQTGGSIVAVVVALDRQDYNATRGKIGSEVLGDELGVPVASIATLADIVEYLRRDPTKRDLAEQLTGHQAP